MRGDVFFFFFVFVFALPPSRLQFKVFVSALDATRRFAEVGLRAVIRESGAG